MKEDDCHWLLICCPPEWRDDEEKIRKITALVEKFKGKFEGSYKYDGTFNCVYSVRTNDIGFWKKRNSIEFQLIKLIKSWRKGIFKIFDDNPGELGNLQFNGVYVVGQASRKPRQLLTPDEKLAEKARKLSISNVIGQVFTYIEKPERHSNWDVVGCVQAVIFLSEKRGWFKTITLDMDYDGRNQNIRAKSWSRSEIEESFTNEWLRQRDLEFLIKFGSPVQVLLKAIQDHMNPYQQAIDLLES